MTTPVVWKDVSGKKIGFSSSGCWEEASKRRSESSEPPAPTKRPPGEVWHAEAAQRQVVCVGVSRWCSEQSGRGDAVRADMGERVAYAESVYMLDGW